MKNKTAKNWRKKLDGFKKHPILLKNHKYGKQTPIISIAKIEGSVKPTLVERMASKIISEMVAKNMFALDRDFKMTFSDGVVTVVSFKKTNK